MTALKMFFLFIQLVIQIRRAIKEQLGLNVTPSYHTRSSNPTLHLSSHEITFAIWDFFTLLLLNFIRSGISLYSRFPFSDFLLHTSPITVFFQCASRISLFIVSKAGILSKSE